MNSPHLIGLAAGAVSAVLFASLASQSLLSMVLFYLTPLPGFVAGLGWGALAALLTAVYGGIVTAAVLGGKTAMTYMAYIGLPPVILCYLALLRREVQLPNAAGPALEWYPPGRIVPWAALMAGALAAAGILILGGDADSYKAAVKTLFEQTVLKELGAAGGNLSREQIDQFSAVLARFILPSFSATLWLGVMLLNLWLAARIAAISGRLPRPMPRFAQMSYPYWFPLALGGFLGLSLAPGFTGILAAGFAGAAVFAYLLLGLAIVHVITAGMSGRQLLLVLLYVSIALIGWGALAVAAVGLAEPLLKLRQRVLRRTNPPAAKGNHEE